MISDVLSDASCQIEQYLETSDMYDDPRLRSWILRVQSEMDELRHWLDIHPDFAPTTHSPLRIVGGS